MEEEINKERKTIAFCHEEEQKLEREMKEDVSLLEVVGPEDVVI